MMQGRGRSILAAGALLAACAAAWAQGIHPGDAVRVNDETISYQRYIGFYTEYRNSKGVAVGARGDQLNLLMQLRREAMDEMIEQELIRQAAEEAGIEVAEEEVDAAVEELREVFEDPEDFVARLKGEGYETVEAYREHVRRMIAAKRYLDDIRLAQSEVTDEDLEAYYHANEHRLTFPERVRVRHILLTWKPMGTRDDRGAVREQMTPILERARSGEDFAELARELSEDYQTAKNGGDTGLFHRGEMVPAFERMAFSLEPGEISDPVETPYGVHILKLVEKRPPELVPLEAVREQLREHVREERAEQAVEAEIQRLREQAEIEVLIPLSRPESQGG